MSEKKPPKSSEVKPDWIAPPEDVATGAAAAITTVVTAPFAGPAAPFLGIAAGAGVKAIGQAIRHVINGRGASRAQRFEDELLRSIEADPDTTARKLEDPNYQEVLFQCFRRAMDAIDPAVVPTLARLTAMYRDRHTDAFFRGTGRLLQDLSGDELVALRQILTACSQLDLSTLTIVSWRTAHGWELRFSTERAQNTDRILGMVRHPSSVTVLGLLDRAGLLANPARDRHGKDLGMVGDTQIEQVTVTRLLDLVDPIDVHIFPATFDRTTG